VAVGLRQKAKAVSPGVRKITTISRQKQNLQGLVASTGNPRGITASQSKFAAAPPTQ